MWQLSTVKAAMCFSQSRDAVEILIDSMEFTEAAWL
jgi:hypothetical protein